MITQAAFGGTEREMMLDAIAGKHLRGPVVETDGQSDNHGTFGKFGDDLDQPRNCEMISDSGQIVSSHFERRMVVDFHFKKF